MKLVHYAPSHPSSTVASLLAGLLRPLDWLRTRSLHALGRWARPIVRKRELRVTLVGLALVASSLIGALWLPLWVLALGPLLLGIPHVLGDIRHLILLPGFHRRVSLWLVAGLPILACGLGADTRVGMLAIAGICLVARGRVGRRLAVAAVGLAATVALQYAGASRDLYFAHAHNFIAVGLWWAWRARQTKLHWLVLVAFALACGIIMSPVSEFAVSSTAGLTGSAGDMDLNYQLARLAPGLDPSLGVRVVLLYTFCQSVHYGIWLRLVPDEDRMRPTPPPFRTAFLQLWRDFQTPAMLVALALCVTFAVWAVFDLMQANHGYFRVVRFHGFIELAAIALFACEGLPSRRSPSK